MSTFNIPPEGISRISSKMNETELWFVIENLNAGNFKTTYESGYCESSIFVVELSNKESIRINAWDGKIESINKGT